MQAPTTLATLSVANLTIGRMDPARFVEEAAAAGFGRVGLLLASATPNPLEHEIVGRAEVMRATLNALRQTGTTVFDTEAFVLSPRADMGAFRPILAAGAELGATHISAVGAQPETGPSLSPDQRIDLLGRLCDEAAGFGLHVGVEFMLYRDIRTASEALALVDAMGRANAGLILDALHIARAGTALAELARLPPGRIAYAQLCDARAASPALENLPTEARTDRLHPGDGVLSLRAFLDMLPDDTPLAIETPVAAEAGWTTQARLNEAARRTLDFMNQPGSPAP